MTAPCAPPAEQERGPESIEQLAGTYHDFVLEVGEESPCFAAWATSIGEDDEVLRRIAALPEGKRQPNLVLAAARWVGVPAPGPYAALRRALLADDGALEAVVLARSTQTNEAGRLAVLTPAIARAAAGAPIALIEVGASAGLCLYPDRWRYEWPGVGATGDPSLPVLRARAAGPMPVPEAPPLVAWRSGIDLHPLDVRDPDDAGWLRTLVWPEQEDRRARLDRAIDIARRDPPRLVEGDLLELVEPEIERAAEHGRVVVLHSAVIAYLPSARRAAFDRLMRRLVADGACSWISNEGDRVLPSVTASAHGTGRPDERFVLGLDGRAVAWAHGHGSSVTWL